jgi:mannonate dehydratase
MTDTANGPKLTLSITDTEESTIRRVKQIGITYLHMSDGNLPWTEKSLGARMKALEKHGVKLFAQMISGFPNAIYGRPDRDKDIEKVIKSVKVAGKLGLPVVEYNFYAHRIIEGYNHDAPGRGGSGYTDFDYQRVKNLPPLPEEGAHSMEEMWANATYFLKAVIPAAEEAGVRMALHPNDPPAPISRGSEQIMGSIDGWKKLVSIVNSKSNGITFDCGVTRELGGDPVEVCRYFGKLDRINHVHFRNVITEIPGQKYTEVYLDEGEVDMLAVMKELVRQKYPRLIYPEHPPKIDADREHPFAGVSSGSYTGFAYTVGYARATLQAAMKGA